MAKAPFTGIRFSNYYIPLKLYKEWRPSVRYSLGRRYATLRLPILFPRNKINEEIARFEIWIKSQFDKSPKIAERFTLKQYHTGQILKVRGEHYLLEIKRQNRKTSISKLRGNTIEIVLSTELNEYQSSKNTARLIAKTLSKKYKSDIEKRVYYLNEKYFNQEINSVRLKYNLSNWGSCSSNRNINLSSRLLLAPGEVLDYVIIHELAHLVELSHSRVFWNLVKAVMPDYKEKEAWLKQNGQSLIF